MFIFEVEMAYVVELRAGLPVESKQTKEVKPCWPSSEFSSSYEKHIVDSTIGVHENGFEGNAAGFPSHIEDTLNRAILVYNESTYIDLKILFPLAALTLIRGGFGENIVINHPSLLASEVCVGDKFSIGTTICQVTGPRAPCPKVDGWHAVKGLTQHCKEYGCAGYFMRVLQEGQISTGDEFILRERLYPGYTIERISQGLWGKEDARDDSEAFLSALAGMPELIGRHYRETANTRLQRILDKE